MKEVHRYHLDKINQRLADVIKLLRELQDRVTLLEGMPDIDSETETPSYNKKE